MARPRKYDWDDWFNRSFTVLIRGRDYRCSQSSMVQQVRNAALKMGVMVSVIDGGDRVTLVLPRALVGAAT
jgi:hypothetical protein